VLEVLRLLGGRERSFEQVTFGERSQKRKVARLSFVHTGENSIHDAPTKAGSEDELRLAFAAHQTPMPAITRLERADDRRPRGYHAAAARLGRLDRS
jgi:hypothetical protein